ncbi:MAG: 50S ribosomal protein L29 [Acidimicrobiia bacterium]|nr:50S ribosomal protein L29 [Acidimicrobiia bacterium]
MARSKSLADLSDVELLGMLDQAKDEATNLRFQHVTGQLDNVNLIAGSRKQVARILTELRAREISTAEMVTTRQADDADASAEVETDATGAPRVFKRRRRRDD